MPKKSKRSNAFLMRTLTRGSLGAEKRFVPGKPIPAGGVGQYGLIRGVACGTADVFGNGSYDLFVGLRSLYPFERFDEQDVPVYGKMQEINSPYAHGYVFEHGDVIYALVFSQEDVHLLKYDQVARQFVAFSSGRLPNSGKIATGFIGRDGKLHVFYTRGAPGGKRPSQFNSHKPSYRPYDGSGFWRGGTPVDHLYYARWSTCEMKKVETHARVAPDDREYEFPYHATGLAMVKLGAGNLQHRLIAVNRFGLFKSFINASSTSMAFDGVAYAVDETSTHTILRHPVILPKVVPLANPNNGLSDLLVSDTGRIWHYPFKGIHNDHYPIYGQRRAVLAAGQPLELGALPVISPGDVDGDGKVDLVAGNDSGEFLFIKNIGTSKQAEFANPVEILVDGEHYRIHGGYNGSIQGPGEGTWGYTCPTLFDWNGDGKLDIITNSIRGNLKVMLQEDGKANPPMFGEALPLFHEGLELHLGWRVQPGVTTWGGETAPCLIANDENNQLRLFYRLDNQNVKRGPVLRLENGQPIQAHGKRFGGQFGRSKIVAVDWDGDGRIDLLIGTGRAQSFPGKGGIPDTLRGDERQASVLFLRNVGTNAKPEFAHPLRATHNGATIKLGIHSCSPAVANLGNGQALVVGMEKGKVMYYPKADINWV